LLHVPGVTGLGSGLGHSDITKRALLEEQDLMPTTDAFLLLQTTDQDVDDTFVTLEPPFDMDDYLFGQSNPAGMTLTFDLAEDIFRL
jgi:hypothetical protein